MLLFSFSITLLKHFGGDGALPEELRLAVGVLAQSSNVRFLQF